MKKTLLTVIAALLAFCACNKPVVHTEDNGRTYALDQLQFNFTIEKVSDTKGIRSGWLYGDKVFVFFGGYSDAYVTVTYDGSAWSADPVLPDGMSVADLPASGVVTAVYLPYGNDLTPSLVGSAWTFPGTNDYYYLQAQKTTYFITDTGNKLPTLGAYLYMETAQDYIQFYLPDSAAESNTTIQLGCNYLVPGGIAGISLDGTIVDASDTSVPGNWVTGRADTIDGDKGYYASGKLIMRPGYNCYLIMNNGGAYKHYYKQRESVLSPGRSYILPTYENWKAVSSTDYVIVAGSVWSTVNVGAANPWVSGDTYTAANMNSAKAPGTLIPADADWNTLLERTKAAWIQISIANTEGFLVIDRADPGNYIFLHCDNYWSTSVIGGIQHYFKSASDGTHEVSESNPPLEACVRLVSTDQTGTLNPPENGGGI